MDNSVKEMIIERLQTDLDVYIPNSDGTEHTVRCPFCGDSSHSGHAHFGIMIDVDEDTPMMCNCLKCGEGGLLTESILDDIGVYLNREETLAIKGYNKKMAKLANSRRTIIKRERYKIPPANTTMRSMEKIEYLSRRLGIEYTMQMIATDKIVLSLFDFMAYNEIDVINSVQKWMQYSIEENYVGFLSSNNNCITFRCIRDNPKMRRYQKVILNPFNQDPATFFSIPSQVDLFYTSPIHVHIAEGTFDILSIKYNLQPEAENQAFYAACGYSYLGIIKNLARHGISTNIHAHIYADKDKTDQMHRQLLRNDNISEFLEHVIIHRNAFENEKDFGVPMNRIIDKHRKLW